MTEQTIPEDGQVALWHEEINSGLPIAFMLYFDEALERPEINKVLKENVSYQINIEPVQGERDITSIVVFMSIQLMRQSSEYGEPKEEKTDREILIDILQKVENIAVITREGVHSGFIVRGHILTLTEYEDMTIASMRLETDFSNLQPADYDTWKNSKWVDEDNLPANYSKWYDEESTAKGHWR